MCTLSLSLFWAARERSELSQADDDARIARRAHRAAMARLASVFVCRSIVSIKRGAPDLGSLSLLRVSQDDAGVKTNVLSDHKASAEPAMETAWSARSDAEFEVESEMVAVRGREAWLALLPEMLAVCNEAARRCALKKDASARVYDEPLCADYVYERVALAPGPLGPTGFVAWHRATRKMQGFVVLCEFCTFSRSLKWDSRHAAALAGSFEQGGATMQARRKAACPPRGTSVAECVSAAERVAVASSVAALKRCVDEGALSDKLQREPSEPRPQQLATYGDEILVWPTLLEVALLGALGCGGRLVDRAL